MKIFVMAAISIFCCKQSFSQLKVAKGCPTFTVNLLEGNVNGLEPNFSAAQFKKEFPCFTSELLENDSSRCEGILSYQDHDIYFYTGRDYVEIGPKFKGKLSIPLMGAARGNLFTTLGHPKLKDAGWDAFQTRYGVIVLYYNSANKINKIQFSKKSIETLKLCE